MTNPNAYGSISVLKNQILYTKNSPDFDVVCSKTKKSHLHLNNSSSDYEYTNTSEISTNHGENSTYEITTSNYQDSEEKHLLETHLPNKCASICSFFLPCDCELSNLILAIPQHNVICKNITQKLTIFQSIHHKQLEIPEFSYLDIYKEYKSNPASFELADKLNDLNHSLKFENTIEDFQYSNIPIFDITKRELIMKNAGKFSYLHYTDEERDKFNFYGLTSVFPLILILFILLFRNRIFSICKTTPLTEKQWLEPQIITKS